MKFQIAASTALIVFFGLVAPSLSQSNDPEAREMFLEGTSDTCQGCDLSSVTLSPDPEDWQRYHNVKLRQTNLQGATLADLDLRGSYFSCADLSGADLSGANLSNVDFFYANLSGANLSGADLSAATFRGAIVDETTNLDGVILSEDTIAPNSQFAQTTGSMASVQPVPLDGRTCFGRPE